MGYWSIAHEAKPNGLIKAAIDPWPLRATRLIVFIVAPNLLDKKGNNKASKCKLKKSLLANKTKELKRHTICYARTITNSPLVG